MMNAPENKRPVTLEDLLRLKRAERPSPEFWTKFEAELRAKQLAAIVEKRPWWTGLSLAGLMRHRVLLGSATLLAISFISIREYRQTPVHSAKAVETSPAELASILPVSPIAPVEESVAAMMPRAGEEKIVLASADSVSGAVSPPQSSGESVVVYAGGNAAPEIVRSAVERDSNQSVQWRLAVDRSGTGALSLGERSIADNLAEAKEAHPELTNRFFGVSGFEKRSMPASRQTVDPLAQMRSPSRLLASALPTSSTIVRASDRVVRRISDERLTEEAISRFDARGDRFLLKF